MERKRARKRERESVCVWCVCVIERERERKIENVCFVCMRERERERDVELTPLITIVIVRKKVLHQCSKTFYAHYLRMSVDLSRVGEARVFVPGKHFQPSLTFAGKVGAFKLVLHSSVVVFMQKSVVLMVTRAYPSEPVLRTHIILGWKGLSVINTLIYYTTEVITTVRKFRMHFVLIKLFILVPKSLLARAYPSGAT